MDYAPRIVPDVNVFVSGTSISAYAPSQIIQAWGRNEIEVATSESILTDLARVLQYPKIQKFLPLSQEEQARFIRNIRETALLVPGTTPVNVSPDPDDNKLFSCAIEAEANYIVSGDKKHVLLVGEYEGIKTISPGDFVRDVLIGEKAA